MELRQIGAHGPFIATLGFGTAPLGGLNDLLTEAAASLTVAAALQTGVNLFDTGPLLGRGLAEHRLGTALRETSADPLLIVRVGSLLRPALSDSALDSGYRQSLSFQPRPDYSRDGLLRAFEDSQQRLGLSRIDVLVLDEPSADMGPSLLDQLLGGGFAALAELRSAGLISAIGCALDPPDLAERAVRATDLDLVILPGRLTLLDQSGAHLVEICRQRGLSAMAASPFAGGILASRPKRGARHLGAEASAATIDQARRIEAICAAHSVPLPAAALQFPLRRPEVVCVLPGMSAPEEVAQNAALLRHPVPEALWKDLAQEELAGHLV